MLKYNKEVKMKFNFVDITYAKNREARFRCCNEEDYINHLKSNQDAVENIGLYNQQIKPIFDVDAYDNDIDIVEVKQQINILFPDKIVNYAKREPREVKGKMKYSYRFYVKDVRIIAKNLKNLIIKFELNKNPIYDMSIYDKNKILLLPLTTKKFDDKLHPSLTPIDCNIFDCCASYIEEDYENWDLKIPTVDEPKKEEVKKEVVDDDEDVDNDNPNKYNRIVDLIKLISSNRSECFDSWIKFNWCIINICNKENISRRKCSDLIHQFSKLSKNKYDENDVDNWIDKNYDNVREKGYGWNYLFNTCIKEDNPKYYETVNKSYYNMKREFEINNAKILYPPMIVHIDRNGENIIQDRKSVV